MVKSHEFVYNQESTWSYAKKQNMKETYPKGGYKVIGEVTKHLGKNREYKFENNQGDILYIQPLHTYKTPCYRTYGYIETACKDEYIAMKKNNIGRLLVITLGLIAVLITLFLGYQHFSRTPNIDSKAVEFEGNIQRPIDWDDSKILVPGFETLYMDANTDKVYVALQNPKENPCYFEFIVIRDDTGEELFHTELIPPGKAVTTMDLPNKLEAGKYNITIQIQSYSLEDFNQRLNGAEMKTTIIALQESK